MNHKDFVASTGQKFIRGMTRMPWDVAGSFLDGGKRWFGQVSEGKKTFVCHVKSEKF